MMKLENLVVRSLAACFATASVFGLAGCELVQTAPVAIASTQGSALQGSVYGGQQAIVGATLQLYAASTNGYGAPYVYTAGTSLLGNNVVTSLAGGKFSITGDYTCPSSTTPVYLVATGGNPGLASGTNNSAIALVAALGPCGQAKTLGAITINEMTTVASVWALSPFMSSLSAVGTSAASSTGGNVQGLSNAFASVNKLVNIGTGAPGGPALPAGATLPTQKMNTLADILAACVNTAGPQTSTDACDVLFAAATVNGVVPSNTAAAALAIAQNPALPATAIGNLNRLVTAASPFQPALAASPQDFYLVVHYTGGGISSPSGIAADPSGNIWVANAGSNSVSEIDTLGVSSTDATGFLSGTTGYLSTSLSAPSAIAIDTGGNAWVASAGNNSVVSLSPSGGLNASYSTGGNFSQPGGIAIDGLATVWITNTGNSSLTKIAPGGTLSNIPSSSTYLSGPTAIAIQPR